MKVVQVALPIPRRQVFDYLVPDSVPGDGVRVKVPFGPRTLVGVVVGNQPPQTELDRLKPVNHILDETPVISEADLKLGRWVSQYYQHPLGDVLHTLMPAVLRKGQDASRQTVSELHITAQGLQSDTTDLARARRQQQLLTLLQSGAQRMSDIRQQFSDASIKGLIDKGLAEKREVLPAAETDWHQQLVIGDKPRANQQQALAITGITHQRHQFGVHLLEGVTGSGKTEVYLQCIEPVISAGQQVLILVPEIGLTPQTVERFRRRFNAPVGVLHSGLTDNERLLVWQQSRAGELAIIIGTRSAIFTPLKMPGMLIVDEEHDTSYKQQDGLRYHARDVAVVRARNLEIPLILGSATPSLETLNNALSGRFQHFELSQRAGNALQVSQRLLDIRNQPLTHGLAPAMVQTIQQHLTHGGQVMVFLNRRGFAPALLCHTCGHVETCQRCDKPYTLHASIRRLQCHHCAATRPIPSACQQCGSADVAPHGIGTEQLEAGLAALFPTAKSVRIDSDSTRGKARLQQLLDDIKALRYQLLIGTQILSKGHHFPHVTLVVVLDADGALFSADYRAPEHLAQLITQLAGRAGRAEKPGEMWLQTHNPGHPLLQDLVNNGYAHFARFALRERRLANLPPHTYQALVRAEAMDPKLPMQFLIAARQCFTAFQPAVLSVGPFPALMEKRQGRFRMQLILQSTQRPALQQALAATLGDIEKLPQARNVRWSVDVDPQDFM